MTYQNESEIDISFSQYAHKIFEVVIYLEKTF